jgi:hypothetical protein
MNCKETCVHIKQHFKTHEEYLTFHREWRAKNSEKVRAAAKLSNLKRRDKQREWQRGWRNANRQKVREYHREYMKTYRLLPSVIVKDRARRAVLTALAAGTLERQPCEVCGFLLTEAHHLDYTKPLDVKWLCTEHHGEMHRMPASDYLSPSASS